MENNLWMVVSSCGAFDDHTTKIHGIFDDFDKATESAEKFAKHCKDIYINRPSTDDVNYIHYMAKYERETELNNVLVIPYTLNEYLLNGK